MNISEFVNNDTCPLCGKKMTLFVRHRKEALWKAERQTQPSGYYFQQHLVKNNKLGEKDAFILDIEGDKFNIHCNSSALQREIRTWQFFFFYVCNPNAITKEWQTYKINTYEACYIRNSIFMEMMPTTTETGDTEWVMSPVMRDSTNINRDETFSLSTKTEAQTEKVYFLTLNYEKKTTNLFHYSATKEQNEDANYEPNVFQKEMPLMSVRPDFSDRGKLIERLDAWVLMS